MNTRSLQTIALAAASAASLAACDDPTRPEQPPIAQTPQPSAVAPSAAMALVGRTLGDATNPFILILRDAKTRAQLEGALDALALHLEAGQSERATADVVKARALLAKLTPESASELAPVALALDHVEAALRGEDPQQTPAAPIAP